MRKNKWWQLLNNIKKNCGQQGLVEELRIAKRTGTRGGIVNPD
jgi:hypothetical protein